MKKKQQQQRPREDGLIFIDLPAPSGWSKKFFPKQSGLSRRDQIVFISPTGERIKTKTQLERYLKSHPGDPAVSEFDWGTGDSPRRSARLSQKLKETKELESEPPKKKLKRSNEKKEPENESDSDGEDEAAEETGVSETDAEDSVEQVTGTATDESTPSIDTDQKTDDEGPVVEQRPAEDGFTHADNKDGSTDELKLGIPENQECRTMLETKVGDAENEAQKSAECIDSNKDNIEETSMLKLDSQEDGNMADSNETAKKQEAASEVPDTKVEESGDAKFGQGDHIGNETSAEEAATAYKELREQASGKAS